MSLFKHLVRHVGEAFDDWRLERELARLPKGSGIPMLDQIVAETLRAHQGQMVDSITAPSPLLQSIKREALPGWKSSTQKDFEDGEPVLKTGALR